jgi:hypothetical protein
MFKRVATLIFVLAVTGQAFARVCGCFAIEGKMHSCCKPHNAKRDSVYPKGCCDDECLTRASERTSQGRAEVLAKIPAAAKAGSAPAQTFSFVPIAANTEPKISPFGEHRLKYSRPPELYLRNHAFLI